MWALKASVNTLGAKRLYVLVHIFVCPWNLAVPIAGELQAPGGIRTGVVHCDASWSTSCSMGVMSSNTALCRHAVCASAGSDLAASEDPEWTQCKNHTVSQCCESQPFFLCTAVVTSVWGTQTVAPSTERWVCRNHSRSWCLPFSQSGDGAAWFSPFPKRGRESLGVLEQCTNIIAWKPGICQGVECSRHGNSSPRLTAKWSRVVICSHSHIATPCLRPTATQHKPCWATPLPVDNTQHECAEQFTLLQLSPLMSPEPVDNHLVPAPTTIGFSTASA